MSPGTSRHPSLDELSAWADGEIGGELERQVLAEHVGSCPTCASLVEDFRALAGAQAAAVVPPVPPRLEKRVREAVAREGRRARSGSRRLVVPLGAAATILVGVAALWLWRQQPAPALPTGAESVAPAPAPAAKAEPQPEARAKAEEGQSGADVGRLGGLGYMADAEKPAPPPAKRKLIERPEAPQEDAAAPPVAGTMDAAEAPRQQVAVRADVHRWVRLPAQPDEEGDQAFAGARREAEPSAPAAAGSEAPDASAPMAKAARDRETCPVLDQLEPPLRVPGLDAGKAEEIAAGAREAGASATTLETGGRLTLLVPVRAWPRVRAGLLASGMAGPDAAGDAPRDAACLLVPIEPAP